MGLLFFENLTVDIDRNRVELGQVAIQFGPGLNLLLGFFGGLIA